VGVSLTFTPPHHDLTYMAPLSEQRADRLVSFLAAERPGSVLDIGCGWAALLLRVLEAVPDAVGEGIDLDQEAISHGQSVAVLRGLTDRVDLRVDDARDLAGGWDAVICIGASQVWGAPVEEAQPLPYAAAFAALRALVSPGGRVVYGDGIWSSPPTPAAIAPLAGREDEFRTLGEVVDLAVAAGFAPLAAHEASLDEWDVFESGYAAAYARWLAEHDADDPDAAQVRELADRQRTAYFSGYRGVLGLGYLELLAV
jgi:cyclopropane fatty-acyl-phospholipid synthase-like methyltransferase